RPVEYSPQVQPMIPTPTHGALPSGHATEAFMTARLLWKIIRASGQAPYCDTAHWGEMLMRAAARIATNRTVAGVHFPVDSAAGALLGLTLADFVQVQCAGQGQWTSAAFTGTHFPAKDDFNWHALYDAGTDTQAPETRGNHRYEPDGKAPGKPKGKIWATTECHAADKALHHSKPLNWLWEKAVQEWRDPSCASAERG
ncbi:MAG: phosphatase PAP2 family protein, partial [Pseudomonadota bacterium]